MKKYLLFLSLIALAALACSISVDLFNPPPLATPIPNSAPSATPFLVPPTFTPLPNLATVTPLPPTPTPVNDTPALTVDQLKNAHYDLLMQDGVIRTVQLQDGKYQEGSEPATPGFATIVMGELVAFGDLNGDGAQDAAVTLAADYGGTGVFVTVAAMLNQGGLPVFGASYYVDDRPIINALSVVNGEIFLDAIVHGVNDAMCCPALPTKRTLRYWQNTLVMASFSSKTPTGAERIITIDSPANGAEVEKIFSLKGNCTIAPFENTLAYAVYIPGMADPFTQGPLMVNAPDLGAPGTFELPLNFTAAGYSGPVLITISDLSAADGSVIAQAAVFLVVK